MCWRDEIETTRCCSQCGQTYFGNLGHIGCPGSRKHPLDEKAQAIAERHGWSIGVAREKIRRTKEILVLKSEEEAMNFLLETIPNKRKDIIDKLEEDNSPF